MIFWLSGSSICYFPPRARWLRSIGRTCPLSAGITSVGTGHSWVRRRALSESLPFSFMPGWGLARSISEGTKKESEEKKEGWERAAHCL